MRLEFNALGDSFGNRKQAARIRGIIERNIAQEEEVVFDFKGVGVVTSSFADECFGKLVESRGLNFVRSKTRFINTNQSVSFVIKSSINKRIRMNNMHH